MIRRAHLLACVASLLFGCGSQSTITTTGGVAPEQTDPPLGKRDLARDLEATVLENYTQLTLGNLDAYADAIARDRDVVLIGLSARDVVLGRNPEGAREVRLPFSNRSVKLLAKNLEVCLSADGSVGWVYDELSYRVAHDGRNASIPIRFTGVFVRDIDRWVMVLEHLAYALPIEEIITLARAGALKRPEPICRKRTCGGSGRSALRGVIDTFHSEERDNVLANVPEALLLWPDPDEEYAGAAVTEAPRLAALFGPDATVEVVSSRSSTSRSDKVAWLTAELAVRTNDEDALVIRLRGTYVLERVRVRTNQFRWEVVLAHVSVPVEERELARRVFGTPKGVD